MKKLIGTAMLAALFATSAFAELSISGGATQFWSPIAYNGGDVMTGSQNPWGGGRTGSVGFTWVSEDEKAGAQFSMVYDPWVGGIQPDGNRIIWVKPWDFLKLSLGRWDGILDVSTVNTASWGWVRPNNWFESNLYYENEGVGALFQLYPIEGLSINVGLPFGEEFALEFKDIDESTLDDVENDGKMTNIKNRGFNADVSYHMFEALRADVAYTITDIATITLGWRGGRATNKDVYKADGKLNIVGEVDVLVNLLAVENLQLDVGARVKVYGDSDFKKGKDLALVGIKAGYNIMDNFAVNGDFAVVLNEKDDPRFQFGVGVGVGLTDSLSLDADFRAQLPNKSNVDPTLSFLVGLNYACSTNASVGIGFQGKTNGGQFGPLKERKGYTGFGFAVPIKIGVSF